MSDYRSETDSLGEVQVPSSAYYGAQSQRAKDNFPISARRMPRAFIRAMGIIKAAAAEANMELGLLDEERSNVILHAASEVADGKYDDDFVVDVYQTGSGTSTNMNTNEIISNRAIELLKGEIGSKSPVHPNDHVNMGQSSNDVIPTALHIATLETIQKELLPMMHYLHDALEKKAKEFDDVVKIGRTHLQDAVPVRLGQEFGGYASQVSHGIKRVESTCAHLQELALGGTAVGTGLNTPEAFPQKAIDHISRLSGVEFKAAENRFEALAARDAAVETSGQLKTFAVSLIKIVNDLRWLGSGPRCGIGEISLPSLQPGSSIMPGKVNPVIPESTMMLCATVIGNDAAITVGGQHGNFELNVMIPMIASHLLDSISLLSNGCRNLVDRCINGIEANRERAAGLIEGSLAMVTALAPIIGYDAAAKIAKESFTTGKPVRQLALEHKVLSEEKITEVLDPMSQTEPGIPGK